MRQPPISERPRPRFDLLSSGSSTSPLQTTPLPAANGYSEDVNKSKYTPWYRKKKGLAIIILGAFVVVGVIVGVAVGVTQSKNNGPPVRGLNELTTASTTATPATTTITTVITRTAPTTTIVATTGATSIVFPPIGTARVTTNL